MFELVATSKELSKRKTEGVPEGRSLKIGRQPTDGMAIPWDSQISREHVECTVKKEKLHVRKLAEARNAVYYKGKDSKKFSLSPGEEFRIGRTSFALTKVDALDYEVRKQLTQYKIKKKLGEGPLGVSFAGQDLETGRGIVLKVLTKDQGTDDFFANRFLSDAQALLNMPHAHLPDMLDATESGRLIYYCREYVQGNDLQSLLADRGILSMQKSLEVIQQAVRGIEFLESKKLVHRNIKPSNLILRVGSVNLVDIGIAGMIGKNRSCKVDGEVNYMSPEQALDSERLDVRTDIYSLGCIWYEMLTGTPPYQTSSPQATLIAHSKQPTPDVRRKNPKISDRIAGIIDKMMAKSFRNRYQTSAKLMKDLEGGELSGISIRCDQCGQTYRVPATAAGKRLKCRDCEAIIQVRVNLTVDS